MIYAQKQTLTGNLTHQEIQDTLYQGLGGRFAGKKVLVLLPDHTRTIPLAELFPLLVEVLRDARQLDFMVALGTHPGLTEEQMLRLVGITAEQRAGMFAHVRLLNHAWDNPATLTTLGVIGPDEIAQLAGPYWHASLPLEVPIQINKAALECDEIIILGPTFPHEVVGFSGGAKYLFPGISGADMINATHWLAALAGVVDTIGLKHTPVRAMIHAAASRLQTPVTLAALVVSGHDLAGMFIGDLYESWSLAADLSAQKHIQWCEKPFQQVLSAAPAMYDELWTAGKAAYKLEPAMAHGGETIIYAPHLDTISITHGKYIAQIGYHTLPYFLNDWERFKHIPLGVIAHSTHVRGGGIWENGVEKPNLRVTLASKVPAEECARLNLGYLDPARVDITAYQNREEEGILYVPKAGEILYRLGKPL